MVSFPAFDNSVKHAKPAAIAIGLPERAGLVNRASWSDVFHNLFLPNAPHRHSAADNFAECG